MTTKDAIKHLSYKISYYKAIDENWADSVSVDALEVAVRAMAEERNKGEWIREDNPNYSPFDNSPEYLVRCSLCHKYGSDTPYCPKCGADMRKEKDDD